MNVSQLLLPPKLTTPVVLLKLPVILPTPPRRPPSPPSPLPKHGVALIHLMLKFQLVAQRSKLFLFNLLCKRKIPDKLKRKTSFCWATTNY